MGQMLSDADPFVEVDPEALAIRFDASAAVEADLSEEDVAWVEAVVGLQRELMEEAIPDALWVDERAPEGLVDYFWTFTESEEDGESAEASEKGHCGGSTSSPFTCYSWRYFSTTWSSASDVGTYLTGQGYHQTAYYASYGGYGADYTYQMDASCATGIVRYQGIVYNDGGSYKWRRQYDLNPEVYSGGMSWPHWWWSTYVAWWHSSYC